MSVIVLGMEMPENCKQCLFSRYILGEYFCRTTTTLDEDGEEMWESIGRFGFIRRPDCCPLRPLPEKHGRIVDVGPLDVVAYNQKGHEGESFDDGVVFMLEKMDALPTIVEAEGE